MSGIDRKQIIRIDCTKCHGLGYVTGQVGETACPEEGGCGGSGTMEREVPFKFETNGRRNKDEIAEIFGVPVEEIKDSGHSSGE